jgi:glycosyltransferase involved in cell wall biosynthesis
VALGIPAVVADLPTIRAHFSADEVHFFEPGDASSLAAAIVQIARDPEAAARRVEAARTRYQDYRWQRNAATYTELLWRLAERPRRGRLTRRAPGSE